MMNVPLMLAYLKNRNKSVLLISILCCIILSSQYKIVSAFFILEYISYFIIYKIMSKNKFKFVNIFIFLKILFYLLYEAITKPYTRGNIDYIKNALIIIIPFIIITFIIVLVFKKASEIITFQQDRKKLQDEKDLRISLFKITHEIKNPITVCKGYLDMFDYEDKQKSKKFIGIMKNEINRVLILLEDFLSINKIKIEKDIIDINLLLEEVTNNFIPILKEKNIDRIFNISKDEIFIDADYNRLNQVLINVIKNSIEAIQDNGVICVFLIKNKNDIEIHVEDNGIGMDEEELQKIAEPFFTTKKNGSGLGVYLSRQIVEEHGGNIKYISKKYIGTKTIITLPYEEIID
jgi:signal transduction histidine kinase